VNSNQFEIAENNLKNEDIRFFNGNYNKDFFEGVILYYKKDFVNAEISFKEAILYDEERESGSVKVSTIFYLLCLLHLKRDYLASSFIYNLQPLKLKDESNEWIDNFNIPEKQEGLISGLEKLKLNEEQKASLLYYKTCLIGEKRTMTREDATKIIKNLKEIKLGYSREFEYQFYLSTAFYTLGSYDKAYEHKIRASFVKAEDTYVEPLANIEKTSEEFKNGLIKTIKKYVEEDARNKPDNYIESELSEVVDYFWEKKRYFLIAELYHYVEDNSELYLPDEYLFHFGYSLKENDEPEEAKKCYERSLENKNKSSSVLNNLAIIYEKEGNLKRAKELILEAFSLTDGSDEIVNRNKVRLIAPKKKMVQQGARNQVKVIEPIHHITYDTIRDIITYKDGKTLTLRNGDNITKIICEIFRKPKSAHLEQDLLDLIGSDGNRTIYDAVVNINKKFRSLGAKSNLLTFSSGKVTVTLEYVNDLKIIEPS
jgi:hypothetical protein